jgi:transposase
MKKWQFTLGVDVSKLTLDFNCAEINEHIQVRNDPEGFTDFLKWCRLFHIDLGKSILVMEYTGGY